MTIFMIYLNQKHALDALKGNLERLLDGELSKMSPPFTCLSL